MTRVLIFVALMSVRALATDADDALLTLTRLADTQADALLTLTRQLTDTQARLATLEKLVGMSDAGASVSDGTHSDSHPTDSVRTGGRRLKSSSNTASITYQGGALNFDSDIIVRGTINATGQISKEVIAFLVTATQDSSFSSNSDVQYVAFDSVEFNRGGGYDYSDTSAFIAPVAGVYMFYGHYSVASNGWGTEACFTINGNPAPACGYSSPSTNQYEYSQQMMLELEAGNKVRYGSYNYLPWRCNPNGNSGKPHCWWGGYLLTAV